MNDMQNILATINSPADLAKLSYEQLDALAAEIRAEIVRVVYRNGGHLGSNLGSVELTLALHFCFDFATDRLVWDVGHQTYCHKLITGRRAQFDTLRRRGGLSGFPNKDESPYDLFNTGHSSTAISTALGLACGDKLREQRRKAVAVVGDGAIAVGMAFEALNHAGALAENLLVVLNDNSMSISKTVGALSAYLTQVRSAPAYLELKRDVAAALDKLPIFGGTMRHVLDHIKVAVRDSVTPGRMFSDLGFHYYGPADGHDIGELIETLNDVKDLPGPTLLHVITEKGRGHENARNHQHCMHSVAPEKLPAETDEPNRPSWTSRFSHGLVEIAAKDSTVAALTVAMPDLTSEFREQFPERHFDPGICEQHALGFAAGLATAGMKPVVAIYSTFLQRAYDQVFHEICLQNAPVLLVIDRAGLVGNDGPTHHGVFDIAGLRHLPNITLMAPKDPAELRRMMDSALSWGRPCAIRIPRESIPQEMPGGEPLAHGKAEILCHGDDAAIIAYGAMVSRAMEAAGILAGEGIGTTVVNARFAKPIDADMVAGLVGRVPAVVTVEDGALAGGFGSAVLECAAAQGLGTAGVRLLGVPDVFVEHGTRSELLASLGLDASGVADAVKLLRKERGV